MSAAGNVTNDFVNLSINEVQRNMNSNRYQRVKMELPKICTLPQVKKIYSETQKIKFIRGFSDEEGNFPNIETQPFHICFKLLVLDSIPRRLRNLISRGTAIFDENVLKYLTSLLELNTEQSNIIINTIAGKILESDRLLRNNRGRNGETPLNTKKRGSAFIDVEDVKKYGFLRGKKIILDDSFVDSVILSSLHKTEKMEEKTSYRGFVNNIVSVLSLLFHPVNSDEVAELLMDMDLETTKETLAKLYERQQNFELMRRLDALMDRGAGGLKRKGTNKSKKGTNKKGTNKKGTQKKHKKGREINKNKGHKKTKNRRTRRRAKESQS